MTTRLATLDSSDEEDLEETFGASTLRTVGPKDSSGGGASDSRPPHRGGLKEAKEDVDKDEGASTQVKPPAKGNVIKIVASDGEVCRGMIGRGGTFCTKRGCFKKHQGGRFLIEHDAFFIVKQTGDSPSAYCSPCLQTSNLSEDAEKDWEKSKNKKTPDEWRQAFTAVETRIESQPAGPDEAAKLEQELLSALELPSPVRGSESAFTFGGFFERYSSALDPQMTEDDADKVRSDLLPYILDLDKGLRDLSESVEDIIATMTKQGKTFRDTASSIEARFQSVRSELGDKASASIDQKFFSPTLWAIMSNFSGSISELESAPANSSIDDATLALKVASSFNSKLPFMVGEVVKAVSSKKGPVQEVRGALETFSTKVVRKFNSTTGRLNKICDKLDDLNKADRHLGDEIDQLSAEVKSLKVKSTTSSTGASMEPDDSGSDDSLSDPFKTTKRSAKVSRKPKADLGDYELLRSKIVALEVDIKALKSEADTHAIAFCKLGISTFKELQAWAVMHFPDNLYGVMTDAVSLFELIATESKQSSTSDKLSSLEKQKKLKFKRSAEADAAVSLDVRMPTILHNGTIIRSGKKNPSYFSECTSYEDWAAPSHGLAVRIDEGLEAVTAAVEDDINIHLSSSTRATAEMVAKTALKNSESFIRALLSYIENTYKSLKDHNRYTEEQAWSVTTRLVTRVFRELHDARVGANKMLRADDQDNIRDIVLWTTFKTQDVMKEFTSVQFKNHPAISSELIKFLATNSGHEKVGELEKTVTELKERVKQGEKDLQAARKKADSASTHVDDMKKQLAAMKKVVDSIKK